ncbi:ATP-binding cassette domain-containing protein [Treponema sp.]|uniref:ATP-binding cassette domain-containing protein n=1 Tax=Treponema sp. TaxID=166 RepID=UPI0025E447CD|nr:ATP-binding cassette domain-containing protein [Treponema sp.]MBR4321555.1 ATP-binding cassette domain-containing protein [Treponema sp.]
MKENSLIYINNCRVQDLHGSKIASLNWEMRSGEAWLVIGPNGGGKADFLRALAGEQQILPNDTTGDYSTHFEDSVEIVSLERAASLIQQERDLDESEYINKIDEGRTGRRFICEVLGGPDAKHRHLPLPPIADRLETLPEVKLCGVEKILDRGLKFMSTGEIRRTLLCRALLSGKKLLILSDPFAGLDAQSRTILLEFFKTIVGKQKNSDSKDPRTTIILGMERYHEIPDTITNVLEFAGGEISFSGTKSEYEKLISQREAQKAKSREKEKNAFIAELKKIQSETEVLQNNEENAHGDRSESLVKMNNVNVGWDDHRVLVDFNWEVKRGQHWLIRGPNGSGKTTLLELITGDNHQVFCNDVWLFGRKRGTGETIWDIKKNLGIVSYRWHVEYRMVGGTDLESVIISGFKDSIGLYEQKTDVEIQAARLWLKLGGFEGREHENFGSLSYGEQRAILILRAAVKAPKILILDEPCHGLDENYRQKILDLIETVAETGTTTILHVTHDPSEALPCEKHILELKPGESPMYQIIAR